MAWNDAQKETIEMVAISSVVPLIPNMNVGENERLSFDRSLKPVVSDFLHSLVSGWVNEPERADIIHAAPSALSCFTTPQPRLNPMTTPQLSKQIELHRDRMRRRMKGFGLKALLTPNVSWMTWAFQIRW